MKSRCCAVGGQLLRRHGAERTWWTPVCPDSPAIGRHSRPQIRRVRVAPAGSSCIFFPPPPTIALDLSLRLFEHDPSPRGITSVPLGAVPSLWHNLHMICKSLSESCTNHERSTGDSPILSGFQSTICCENVWIPGLQPSEIV